MKAALVILCAGLLSVGSALAQALAEPQITKVMKEANEAEVDAAKLAKKRANNDQVKAFAKKMIDEHEKNEKDVKKVADKKDIGMDRSDASKALHEQAEEQLKGLKKAKDADFDRAYITNQVAMHQDLLNKIDNEFLPAAKTPALKEYLSATREHVKAHLDEAKAIESSIR